MKTEDEILAQLRASQNVNLQNIPLPKGPPPTKPLLPKDDFPPNVGMTPNLEDLQKLLREDTPKESSSVIDASAETQEHQVDIYIAKYRSGLRQGIATCIVSSTFISFISSHQTLMCTLCHFVNTFF